MKKKLEEEEMKEREKHKSLRTMRSVFQSCPEKKNLLILDLLKKVKKHERENALSQVNVFPSNLSHFPIFASERNSNAEP